MTGNSLIDGDNGSSPFSPKYTGKEPEVYINCTVCDRTEVESKLSEVKTEWGTEKICLFCKRNRGLVGLMSFYSHETGGDMTEEQEVKLIQHLVLKGFDRFDVPLYMRIREKRRLLND